MARIAVRNLTDASPRRLHITSLTPKRLRFLHQEPLRDVAGGADVGGPLRPSIAGRRRERQGATRLVRLGQSRTSCSRSWSWPSRSRSRCAFADPHLAEAPPQRHHRLHLVAVVTMCLLQFVQVFGARVVHPGPLRRAAR